MYRYKLIKEKPTKKIIKLNCNIKIWNVEWKMIQGDKILRETYDQWVYYDRPGDLFLDSNSYNFLRINSVDILVDDQTDYCFPTILRKFIENENIVYIEDTEKERYFELKICKKITISS